MSAVPILGDNRDRESRIARAAGWRRSEIFWERVQVRAKEEQLKGNLGAAARFWNFGYLIGFLAFSKNDPRFACSLANAGAAASIRGRHRIAKDRLSRALCLWDEFPNWLADIQLAPRARSSLHHLRISSRHGETFENFLRNRLEKQAREARKRLAEEDLEPLGNSSRWTQEKPPAFDDTRRLAAACFLLAYATPRKYPDGKSAA